MQGLVPPPKGGNPEILSKLPFSSLLSPRSTYPFRKRIFEQKFPSLQLYMLHSWAPVVEDTWHKTLQLPYLHSHHKHQKNEVEASRSGYAAWASSMVARHPCMDDEPYLTLPFSPSSDNFSVFGVLRYIPISSCAIGSDLCSESLNSRTLFSAFWKARILLSSSFARPSPFLFCCRSSPWWIHKAFISFPRLFMARETVSSGNFCKKNSQSWQVMSSGGPSARHGGAELLPREQNSTSGTTNLESHPWRASKMEPWACSPPCRSVLSRKTSQFESQIELWD